jgi:hypothetical protein
MWLDLPKDQIRIAYPKKGLNFCALGEPLCSAARNRNTYRSGAHINIRAALINLVVIRRDQCTVTGKTRGVAPAAINHATPS